MHRRSSLVITCAEIRVDSEVPQAVNIVRKYCATSTQRIVADIMIIVRVAVLMICKLLAVVIYTPIFLLPSIFVIGFGVWLGNVYIKAQLSVKREMSNCKAPVLAMFGSAVHGLSAYPNTSNREAGLTILAVPSIYPGILGSKFVPGAAAEAGE